MSKARLEAFSDGVLAIIITIMVLELKTPHDISWEAVKPLIPVLVSYVISFLIIGTYWANHHHLLHTINTVTSNMIWANLNLLFWLSLIPFATIWMGESNFVPTLVGVYAGLQCICGIAYYILLRVIVASQPGNKDLLVPLEKQSKRGWISFLIYAAAIPAAFIHPAISVLFFVLVLVTWIIPDRNIEKALKE